MFLKLDALDNQLKTVPDAIKPVKKLHGICHSIKEFINDLEALEGEAVFMGPNGLHPVVFFLAKYFEVLYLATLETAYEITLEDVMDIFEVIEPLEQILLGRILTFRAEVPRVLYDPFGIRRLCEKLFLKRDLLGVAESSDRYSILDLNLSTATYLDFKEILIGDFGHTSDPAQVKPECLMTGEHGLDGFLEKIVYPMVDGMMVGHVSYLIISCILRNVCGVLTQALDNYNKADGKKPSNNTQKAKASGPGYNTRSAGKKRSFQYIARSIRIQPKGC
ncbi:hypothetical protein GALMADRAFT_570693 [Galerina marginata CBS 339.88]|uniref:Uncharacterized protein n=1 Tax=Galerina marginata (strain CBS 339.88) TaxID=685588 RepID=A0A067SEA0_GALM3|nr:hypothetical protein GALMADRAFT_570693 [Galerina marginata CBS 339.88]